MWPEPEDWGAMALALLLVFLAALIVPGKARGHDDAQWIMDNPVTSYCCSPTDCRRLDDAEVTVRRDGIEWKGRIFRAGDKDLHPSERDGWWGCTWGDKPNCLFMPASG